jgi:hypothetical protein
MNAPPPSPAENGCVTASANALAIAASTAFPPRSNIARPARAASDSDAHHHAAACRNQATAPRRATAAERDDECETCADGACAGSWRQATTDARARSAG